MNAKNRTNQIAGLLGCLALWIPVVALAAPFRIAVLSMKHESNVFLPNETTLEDFVYEGSPMKGDEILKPVSGDWVAGFIKIAKEYGGVDLVGISSPQWPKTGMGSGWIQNAAYEHFVGIMIAELKAKGPFDGVYMDLHGAMSVSGVPRAEAELARRVRAVVGPKAVLVATFDPHGNEDAEFFRWANMAFTMKYYPHYDGHLQGERAARMMIRTLRQDFRPKVAVRKPPILTPDVNQWTGVSPWMDIVQRALIWEARQRDVFVNFFYGFPWADVPDVGMCFQVLTNGDQKLADEIADDLANYAWRHRERLMSVTPISPLKEGMDRVEASLAAGQAPVAIGDYSDRSGNAVWILGEIVKRGLSDTFIATIRDPRAIETLQKRGVKKGDPFDLEVGGYWEEASGRPVRIKGEVAYVGPYRDRPDQTWVAVRYGKNNILWLSPQLEQFVAPEELRYAGFKPEDYRMFVVKSRIHFRKGFDDGGFAKLIILLEPPGPYLGTIHLQALPYKVVDVKKYFPWGNPVWP